MKIIPQEICLLKIYMYVYHNDPKFSDRKAWANSADPGQTAPDQGLHSLQFLLHLLEALLYGKSNFRVITANFSDVRIFRIFMVTYKFYKERIDVLLLS